uniref:Uncharacterized protein n=1 Tax=Opuntia streptacantha TaxID=393608 RepID=A0A7C8YP48_OPUST
MAQRQGLQFLPPSKIIFSQEKPLLIITNYINNNNNNSRRKIGETLCTAFILQPSPSTRQSSAALVSSRSACFGSTFNHPLSSSETNTTHKPCQSMGKVVTY